MSCLDSKLRTDLLSLRGLGFRACLGEQKGSQLSHLHSPELLSWLTWPAFPVYCFTSNTSSLRPSDDGAEIKYPEITLKGGEKNEYNILIKI